MTREFNVVTPEHVEVSFELAGIGSRFLAVLVDHLIQGLVMIAVYLIFIVLGISLSFSSIDYSVWVIAILFIVAFVITYGYFLYFELTKNGQTPGKKAVGIRVIRDTGHPLDFRSALLRSIMRVVDSLPSMYGVGIISIFASPQYKRVGDYVAGTLVVKVARATAAPRPDTVPNPGQPAYAQTPFAAPDPAQPPVPDIHLPQQCLPLITSITRDEYRAVRHFLDRVNQLDPMVAHNLAIKMVTPIAQKLQLDPAQITEPVAFLMSVSREWERRSIH